MTSADFITALLCHPSMGLGFSSLQMDLSDRYINPQQLQLLTANPSLTQMHVHTKTQANTVQHHVISLGNEAKALCTTYRDCSPSTEVITVQVCVVRLSEGARSVSLGRAAAATLTLVKKIQTRESQQAKEQRDSKGP